MTVQTKIDGGAASVSDGATTSRSSHTTSNKMEDFAFYLRLYRELFNAREIPSAEPNPGEEVIFNQLDLALRT
jgi:hypothetical protein